MTVRVVKIWLNADGNCIFVYDFCTLYILDQKSYELIGKWQLGHDLSCLLFPVIKIVGNGFLSQFGNCLLE